MNSSTSQAPVRWGIRLLTSVASGVLLLAGLVMLPATGASANPSGIEFVAGASQSAPAGAQFATELVVYVPDDEGGGEENTFIDFTISPAGAAHFSNGQDYTTSATGPDGRSFPIPIIAGDTPTEFTLTAATTGWEINPQTSTTLTVTTPSGDDGDVGDADPESITLNGGGQTAPSGQLFADPLFAIVYEEDGTLSDIVPVEFTILPNAAGEYLASFADASHQTIVDTDGGVTPGVSVVADAAGQFEVQATVVDTSISAAPISAAPISLTVIAPLPGAPTINSVTPTLDSIEVDFTPADGDALPTTGYRVDARPTSGGDVTSATGPGSPITVPALEQGATYDVTVVALSDQWESAPSAAMSATLLSLPGRPTMGSTENGYGTITIQFTPGAPGNPAATHYLVGVTDVDRPANAYTYTTTDTTFVAKDLSGGSYNVTVVAVSPLGQSAPASVGPIAVLGADEIPGVAPAIIGDPPEGALNAEYGDDPGFTFTVTGSPAPTVAITSGALPRGITLSGATLQGIPAEAGSFPLTLTASNALGSAQLQVTLFILAPPDPPVIGHVAVGDEQVEVSFSAASTGGAPSQYRIVVTNTADGSVYFAQGDASPITVPGLTNGAEYTFVLAAENPAGSAPTARSGPFTVGTAPRLTANLPTGVIGVAYDGTIDIAGSPSPTIVLVTPSEFPPGLTLNPNTGEITGVPAAGGTFTFKIEASNAIERRVAFTFTITINDRADVGDPNEGHGPPPVVAAPAAGTVGGPSNSLATTGAESPTAPLWFAFALLVIGGVLVGSRRMRRGYVRQ